MTDTSEFFLRTQLCKVFLQFVYDFFLYAEEFPLILFLKCLNAGFRRREPAIQIDGSETLRHPVDILLLELMKAYIFLSL